MVNFKSRTDVSESSQPSAMGKSAAARPSTRSTGASFDIDLDP
jgi:hypothetical protein